MEDTAVIVFETCKRNGFEHDYDRGKPDLDRPICYDSRVRALNMELPAEKRLPEVELCWKSRVVSLKDEQNYCAGCEFHSERID